MGKLWGIMRMNGVKQKLQLLQFAFLEQALNVLVGIFYNQRIQPYQHNHDFQQENLKRSVLVLFIEFAPRNKKFLIML